jgi:calcineurin-like phosphoesterase
MCGPANSILGRAIDPIVGRFISNVPAPFPVAKGDVRLCGALISVDEATGRAVGFSRVNELIVESTAHSAPPPPAS